MRTRVLNLQYTHVTVVLKAYSFGLVSKSYIECYTIICMKDITDTKEFREKLMNAYMDVSLENINASNEELYEHLTLALTRFGTIPAGVLVDTLKLMIFSAIQCAMETHQEEQENEFKEKWK